MQQSDPVNAMRALRGPDGTYGRSGRVAVEPVRLRAFHGARKRVAVDATGGIEPEAAGDELIEQLLLLTASARGRRADGCQRGPSRTSRRTLRGAVSAL